MKNALKKLIGTLPASESGFKRKMRLHQGWWRACVLAEEEGNHPVRNDKRICNTISDGQTSQKNFLSERIGEAVRADN